MMTDSTTLEPQQLYLRGTVMPPSSIQDVVTGRFLGPSAGECVALNYGVKVIISRTPTPSPDPSDDDDEARILCDASSAASTLQVLIELPKQSSYVTAIAAVPYYDPGAPSVASASRHALLVIDQREQFRCYTFDSAANANLVAEGSLSDAFQLQSHRGTPLVCVHPRFPIVAVLSYERLVRVLNFFQVLHCSPSNGSSGKKTAKRPRRHSGNDDDGGDDDDDKRTVLAAAAAADTSLDPLGSAPPSPLPLVPGRVTLFTIMILEFGVDAIAFGSAPRASKPPLAGTSQASVARGRGRTPEGTPHTQSVPAGMTCVPLTTASPGDSIPSTAEPSDHHQQRHVVVDELMDGLDLFVLARDKKNNTRTLTTYAILLGAARCVSTTATAPIPVTASSVSDVAATAAMRGLEHNAPFLVSLPRGIAVVGPQQITFSKLVSRHSPPAPEESKSSSQQPPETSSKRHRHRSSRGDPHAEGAEITHIATVAQPVAVGQSLLSPPQLVGVSPYCDRTASFVCLFDCGFLSAVAVPDDVAAVGPRRGGGPQEGASPTAVRLTPDVSDCLRRSAASERIGLALSGDGRRLFVASLVGDSLVILLEPDSSGAWVGSRVLAAVKNRGPILSIASLPLESPQEQHTDEHRMAPGDASITTSLGGVIVGCGAGPNGSLCHIRGAVIVEELAEIVSAARAAQLFFIGDSTVAVRYPSTSGRASQFLRIGMSGPAATVHSVDVLEDDPPPAAEGIFAAMLERCRVQLFVTSQGVWYRSMGGGAGGGRTPGGPWQYHAVTHGTICCAAADDSSDILAVASGKIITLFEFGAGTCVACGTREFESDVAFVAVSRGGQRSTADRRGSDAAAARGAVWVLAAAWSDTGALLFEMCPDGSTTTTTVALPVGAPTAEDSIRAPFRAASAVLDTYQGTPRVAVLGTADGRVVITTPSVDGLSFAVRRSATLGVAPVMVVKVSTTCVIAHSEDGFAAAVSWPPDAVGDDLLLHLRVTGLSIRDVAACAPLSLAPDASDDGSILLVFAPQSPAVEATLVVGHLRDANATCHVSSAPTGGSVVQIVALPHLPILAAAVCRPSGDCVVLARATGSALVLDDEPLIKLRKDEVCTAMLTLESSISSSSASPARATGPYTASHNVPPYVAMTSPAIPPTVPLQQRGSSVNMLAIASASATDASPHIVGRIALYAYYMEDPTQQRHHHRDSSTGAVPVFEKARHRERREHVDPCETGPVASPNSPSHVPSTSTRGGSIRVRRVAEREVSQGTPYALCSGGADRLAAAINGTVELFRIRPSSDAAATEYTDASAAAFEIVPLSSLRVGVEILVLRRWTPHGPDGPALLLAGDYCGSIIACTVSPTDDSLTFFAKDTVSRNVCDAVCLGHHLLGVDENMNSFTLDLRNALRHPHMAALATDSHGAPPIAPRRMRPKECALVPGPAWHIGDYVHCVAASTSLSAGGCQDKCAAAFFPDGTARTAVYGTMGGGLLAVVAISSTLFKLLSAIETAIGEQLSLGRSAYKNFDAHTAVFSAAPLTLRSTQKTHALGLAQLAASEAAVSSPPPTGPVRLQRLPLPPEEERARGCVDGDTLSLFSSLGDESRHAVCAAAERALYGTDVDTATCPPDASLSNLIDRLLDPNAPGAAYRRVNVACLAEFLSEVKRLY